MEQVFPHIKSLGTIDSNLRAVGDHDVQEDEWAFWAASSPHGELTEGSQKI